jgi:hypothetical protein
MFATLLYGLSIVLLTFVLWGFLDIVYNTIRLGVGPMPPPQRAVQLAIKQVQEHHKVIYDVGGGFGQTAKEFAQRFPNKSIRIIEISYFACFIAKINCKKFSNIRIEQKNFIVHNFEEGAYIYAYLYPSLMPKLFDTLQDWQGRLVCYTFSLRNRKADYIIDSSKKRGEELFVYEYKKSMSK